MNSDNFERYFGKDYFEKAGGYTFEGSLITNLAMFGKYKWEDEDQQVGLRYKYALIRQWAPEKCYFCKGIWKKILFVGCGKGFEVLYFRNKGYDAYGIDISKYAIDNCHPDVKGYVFHEDICSMDKFGENEFDVVVSWNVLPLIDRNRRKGAVRKIVQLASKYIILAFGIEGNRTAKRIEPDGYDGAPIYLEPLYYWIKIIEQFNKFRVRAVNCQGAELSRAQMVFCRLKAK